MEIPFNKEYYTGLEKKYIEDVLDNKKHTRGDGFYTKKVSQLLENKFKTNKVIMTPSGTHALEMAASLINLKADDEVIMPSFTFPSTANAVIKKQAQPVFVEIKEDTLNIDPTKIEPNITDKTRAIMPIHYASVAADMEQIKEIADVYDLYIIEDAAQAVNAKYKDQYLGTLGDFGCFSFHSTKNYISGEGGALLINKDDEQIFERAAILRDKGTNRSRFLKGKVNKYTWVDQGSSYLPSDLLMAFLYSQLEKMDKIKSLRETIFNRYQKEFKNLTKYSFVDSIIQIPPNRNINYNSFYFIFANNEYRKKAIEKLKERKITASFHYIPLHLSEMGKKLGYVKGDLPKTEKLAATIMRIPLYTGMTEQDLDYVVQNIKKVFKELA
jgi:dTDP-4-amino-4,6-dideoxygalactose transaminase